MASDPQLNSIDAMDELYLHHSDHPNYVLSTRLLASGNYSHWKRSCKVSLMEKNKLGFVTGSCLRLLDGSTTLQWDRCNNMVISWLLHSVEKDIAETVLYCRTTKQIWDELGARFGKSNGTRVYQVQRDFAFVGQENLSITDYSTKRKKLWDEYRLLVKDRICSCGSNSVVIKLLEDQQIMEFFMGLNEFYSTVRGYILMMNPPPTMDELYRFLPQEEDHRALKSNVTSPDPGSMVFAS